MIKAAMPFELYEHIHNLQRAGASFAVATVVRVEKPISAKPGDKAVIQSDGTLLGWVGGGCSQDIIVREAKQAIRGGEPRFLRLVGSGAPKGTELAPFSDGIIQYPITCHSGGTMDVYLEPVLPRPQLILFGNSPVAVTLAQFARVMNYEVTVVDPAATRDQFPGADYLSNELRPDVAVRPIAFAVVATQGHDDDEALAAAARSGVPYVAFVASRKKFASRVEFLRERGLSEEQIARIKAPAGIDLGAVTPDEIAVSILAEIVQMRRKAPAAPKYVGVGARGVQSGDVVAALPTEARDVVCGMMVEIATARHISEYQGEKYYFCASSCKAQFEKNPAGFIKQ
jgi:xanthine dehydrogenase accessory factor